MTRVGELDSRMAAVEEELGKLQKGQEETNQRFDGLKAKLEMLQEHLMRSIAEQFGALFPKGSDQMSGGRSQSISKASITEKVKAPAVDLTPLATGSASPSRLESESAPSPIVAKKVEFPVFDGDDPLTWIAKADQYFTV